MKNKTSTDTGVREQCPCRERYLACIRDAEHRLSTELAAERRTAIGVDHVDPLIVHLPDGTEAVWFLMLFRTRGVVRIYLQHHELEDADALSGYIPSDADDGDHHVEYDPLVEAPYFLLRHFVPLLEDVTAASINPATSAAGPHN